MTLSVLIPCLGKDRDGILSLAKRLNIQSNAIFLNQNGTDETYDLEFLSHKLIVVCVSWQGVSRARNELIRRCDADVGLFIDDDCVLNDGYALAVLEAFKVFSDADAIRFNTRRNYWNPVGACAKENRRGTFRDLSSFGSPGLSFRPKALLSKELLFNEFLGAPNYLANGEDSVFLFDLCKASKHVYVNVFNVCDIQDEEQSSWFTAYDKRYFATKGYVYSHLYGRKWWLALLRMYIKYKKEYKMSFRAVLGFALKGHRMYREGQSEKRS